MPAPKMSPAQARALAELPVEVGGYGTPSKRTLRALIRKGWAREVHYGYGGSTKGNSAPSDVVLTEGGREVLAPIRLAELSDDQRQVLVAARNGNLSPSEREVATTMRGLISGVVVTPLGLAVIALLRTETSELPE